MQIHVFTFLLLTLMLASPSFAQYATKPAVIMSRGSGKCLNVNGASQAPGAPIVQWACEPDANSLWTLEQVGDAYQIVASHSKQCLNVSGASKDNGAAVIQWTCGNDLNSLWYVDYIAGFYRFRAKHSGRCLNVPGALDKLATAMIQWDCGTADNELWVTSEGIATPKQRVRLVSNASGLCADIGGYSTTPGAGAIQYPCTYRSDNEVWTIDRSGDAFTIIAEHSKLCLSVGGGSQAENAGVLQWDCIKVADQAWNMQRVAGGFKLLNKNSGKCLAPASATAVSGLVQKTCSADASQVWRIEAANEQGSWGDLIKVPLVPVAAALLQTGKVMLWSAYDALTFQGGTAKTLTAVFDPGTKTATPATVSNTEHDMFCPGTALLSDGRLLVNGGNSNSKTSIYSATANTWATSGPMNIPRGYQSDTVLDTGEVFTIGGSWAGGNGNKNAEVWNPNGSWTRRSGILAATMEAPDPAGVYRGDNHSWLFSLGNARVFHAGPSVNMNIYDTAANGTTTPQGNRADDVYSMNGTAVMYDIGRILKVGGAPAYEGRNATVGSYVIDVNAGVKVRKTASLSYARALHSSVVLPDGRVASFGGQTLPKLFTDQTAHLQPEIWDPSTETYKLGAAMGTPRTYHSIALLLPDARVLVGGGGLCGNACETNHTDLQIYSPSYLFKPDGSLAPRPVINASPQLVGFNQALTVTTGAAVREFSLVRTSSVTHTVNNDQRRIPLTITATEGTNYTLRSPANAGIALPGYYLLFAIDGNGVPSVARYLQVK